MTDLSLPPAEPARALPLSADREAGVRLLLDAHTQAARLGFDPWEFAVELPDLLRAGLTRTDLRVLVVAGSVRHAEEKRRPEAAGRVFKPARGLRLARRSCFVLTPEGLEQLGQAAGPRHDPDAPPVWNGEVRRLSWRGVSVKQFRQPADNQERVLSAFQEDGWPARVDDPLPPGGGVDPAARLRATVKSLNRGLPPLGPRFFTDGTGQGVCWAARGVPAADPELA